jgi:hypothetical protein
MPSNCRTFGVCRSVSLAAAHLDLVAEQVARRFFGSSIAPLMQLRNDVGQRLSMNPGSITALAALFGSVIGALGSSLGTWITQRHQGRRDLLAKTIYHREGLYSDFINESARLIVDALEHDVGDLKNLIPAYALVSRIRLSSSPDVLASAEGVIAEIIGTYSKPNITLEQIRSRPTIGDDDPLRRFSDVCRAELESMQRQM